jgi:hypothetical protein
MAKKYSTRRRNKKSNKKTRRYRSRKIGGHQNEELEHWHLYIKLPSGRTMEIPELFVKTGVGRDSPVISGTVGDIYNYVEDQLRTSRPFTVYWNGKKLDDRSRKIRQIKVSGRTIPLYNDAVREPLVVSYNDELPPEWIEPHDLDLVDINGPQTPR